jgi:hypothetical protein
MVAVVAWSALTASLTFYGKVEHMAVGITYEVRGEAGVRVGPGG